MTSIDKSINRLLDDVDREERSIDQARANRSAARADLRTYEARLEEVRAVKTTLGAAMNDRAGDVRNSQTRTCDELDEGTGGLSRGAGVAADIRDDLEKTTEADDTCSQVHAYLQAEIDRCGREISDASGRISAADRQESAAQSRRSSYVRSARTLADNSEATVRVNVRARY